MMSKGIALLARTVILNYDIIEWRQQSANLKTWEKYKLFSHRAYREQKRAVTTTGKGGYTAKVQNIYGAPPPSTEENNEAIEDIQTIVQGMQTQGYNLEGLAQANAVLTIPNSAVMAQLAHMTVTMNTMLAQLKTLPSEKNNQARTNRKFYCWSCGGNFTHGRKTCSEKKTGYQEEVYYKKGWAAVKREVNDGWGE